MRPGGWTCQLHKDVGFLILVVFGHWICGGVEGEALYNVGDTFGWAVPPVADFYDVWASGLNFYAGDCLTFEFEASHHDVLQVGYQSYLDCSSLDPYLVLLSSNNVFLESSGIASDNNTINFISGNQGDCAAGMRFSFVLKARTSLSAPTPGDSALPPVSQGLYPPAPLPQAAMTPRGKHYSVGDTFGWNLPPQPSFYNASWVLDKVFAVFDTLYFAFDQGAHSVLQVTQAAYESCNTSSYLSAYNLANPTIKLLSSGNYWFICGRPGHCDQGMKFGLTVYDNGALPPGSTTSPTPVGTADAGCKGRGCAWTSKNQIPLWLVLGLILPSVLVIAIIKTWVICYVWRRRQPTAVIARSGKLSLSQWSAVSSIQGKDICVAYTRKELNKATRNFAPDLEIGSGAFGTVYRGTLVDGTVVAIKRTKAQVSTSQDFAAHFLNEVNILSNVNHRNLVRLVGYCIEFEDPIIVYEYVPNGTLLEHLQGSKGNALNSWSKRLEIALETAEALAYLHFAAKTPIYHRDVKSSNILLDDKCHAKVADFGTSRLVPTDATHISTAAMGTFGYIDPEYHATGQLTDKSDVYSFGVVLLELITGQKAVDLRRTAQVNLAAYCIPAIRRKSVEEILDPRLNIINDSGMVAEVQQLAELALVCLAHLKDERPSMKEVVEEVVRIKLSSRAFGYSDKVKNLDLSPLSYDCDAASTAYDRTSSSSAELESVGSTSANDSPIDEPSPSMYQPR